MYPHERSLVKRLANKPFALIGVNSDKDKDKLRSRIAEENITWRSFWNGPEGTQGPISMRWNVRGWPTIYVMDHEGVIRFKGPRGEKMDDAVNQLLEEMGVDVGEPRYSQPIAAATAREKAAAPPADGANRRRRLK